MISCRNYICVIFLLMFSGLSSCAQSGNDSNTLSNNYSEDITIDKSSVIPVLDGKSTSTGIYIHNNTNQDINGIRYDVVDNNTSKLSLIKDSCIEIKAKNSCFLRLNTPELEPLVGGSSILVANYNSKQSTGLISYQYIDSKLYNGVTFGGASLDLNGIQDYGTTYVFVGNSGTANNVGFKVSNDSVSIVKGLNNRTISIASNEVRALELMSSQNITSKTIDIIPTDVLSTKTSIQSALNNNLQVSIIPVNAPNLIMSIIPVLTSQEPKATVTIFNNGNNLAMGITLTSNSPDIRVEDGTIMCYNLIAGGSCSYVISLNSVSNSGSALLTLNYNTTYTKAVPVYYRNGLSTPVVGVIPTQNELDQAVNTARQVRFDVVHFAGESLTNPNFRVVNKLPYSTVTIESNTCGTTIIKNIPCHVIALVTATNLIESGMIYLTLQGQALNQTYNFVSTPTKINIFDSTIPVLTATIPVNNESAVSIATGISLIFSESMNPLTLNKNNIKLLKATDDSDVPLTVQSVTNNNQTVNLTVNTALIPTTEYKILINPNKILDSNGTAIDYSLNESVVAVFTTSVDNVSPVITNFKPDNNARNVSKTPTMFIQFSESMELASLTTSNIMLLTAAGDVFTDYQIYYESSTYSAGLVLINGGELLGETEYQIVLNELAIKDLSGNSLGSAINSILSTFTTADYVAPTVLQVNPANGANNVPESTAFSITFSESMNVSTLIAANIQLKNNKSGTDLLLGTPSYTNGNRTVVFKPVNNLVEAESYSIVINPNEIKDLGGNPIESGVTTQVISMFKVTGYGLVYVIPVPVNGNLGQESGANNRCQAAGSQLIEGSKWKALLAFNNSTEYDVRYYRFNPSAPPLYKGTFIGFGQQINPLIYVVPLSAPISETITGSFWFGAMEVTFESEQRISLIDRCYNPDSERWWGTESAQAAGSVARLNSVTPFKYTYPESPTVMCNESKYLVCTYTDN